MKSVQVVSRQWEKAGAGEANAEATVPGDSLGVGTALALPFADNEAMQLHLECRDIERERVG